MSAGLMSRQSVPRVLTERETRGAGDPARRSGAGDEEFSRVRQAALESRLGTSLEKTPFTDDGLTLERP
jgi:hypothetical protein